MANKRDYYEILGVSKSASKDDIKSAYRKLALKWHPDRWINGSDEEKKTAEDNFKEASEAYSVLSDDNKRAKYDQFGHAGFSGAGSSGFSSETDLNDILNSIFGNGGFGGFGGFSGFGGFGSNSRDNRPLVFKGRDIRKRVHVTLEDVLNGVNKEVEIERDVACSVCGGKGSKDSSKIKTCPTCNGTGQEQRVVNSIFGQSISYTTCSRCHGEGKVNTAPCSHCHGTSLVRKKEKISVSIPAGVQNGIQLSVKGEGHSGKYNGIKGDLLIVIEELKHKDFVRDGQNLQYVHTISVTDAVLGSEIIVPGLDGKYKLKIKPGTQSGEIYKIKGKGLPAIQGFGYGIGDIFVKILVWIPRDLTNEQKKHFEKLKEGLEPKPNEADNILFNKLKTNF